MPIYLYRNPTNGDVVEIIQRMTEAHIYEKDGVKYERVFLSPQASIDTNINPNSSKDFVEKTRNKKGSVGDLWTKSEELAHKRGDPDAKYKYWSQKRNGKVHPDIEKRQLKQELSKKGFELTDN